MFNLQLHCRGRGGEEMKIPITDCTSQGTSTGAFLTSSTTIFYLLFSPFAMKLQWHSWNTPCLLSLTQERQGSLPRSFYFYHQAPDRCDTYKNRVRLRWGSCTKALWKQSPGGQKLPVQQNSKSLLHLDYRLQKQGFTNLLIHGILSWRC